MKRTIPLAAAALLSSSAALAQGGYTVAGGSMPVAPANPPQGAIAVMPTQNQATASRTVVAGVREPRRPEDYGGVAPGANQIPPGMRRLARARNPGLVVAWPGFQMVPGGSRVFVVSTAGATPVEAGRTATQRTYFFPRARLFLSNNARPLETVAFPTPLTRAFLRSVRGGVNLVLDLRADVAPRVSTEPAANGLVFHYFDLPAFTLTNEVARIRLSNGLEVSATPQGPVVPGVVVGPVAPAGPVVDNERPPPVMR